MENNRMVTLNKENLEILETMVGDIPTRFGLPILDYLKKLYIEQNQKQVETPVIDKKDKN